MSLHHTGHRLAEEPEAEARTEDDSTLALDDADDFQ